MSSVVSPPRQSRIFYLDTLRAFCMIYGVFVHGTTISHANEPLFSVIGTTSDLFRMATFFVIAGFFTAMAHSRKSGRDYVESRGQVLLVPLISTMLLVVPLTNYLIHTWHNAPMSLQEYFLDRGWASRSQGADVWHLHLWFLMSLVVYAALAPGLAWLSMSRPFAAMLAWFARRPSGLALVIFAVGFAFVVMALRALHDQVLDRAVGGTRIDWLLLVTLYYLPFFTLGVAMFHQQALFRLMHQINLAGLALFGAIFMVTVLFEEQLSRDLGRVLYWIGRAGLILMIVAALIRLFELYMNKPSRMLAFLVDSSFTFYLFHLTFIFVVAWVMRPLTENTYVIFAVVLVVVPAIVFVIHAWLIAPNPTLSLMFNGRVRRKPAPAIS